MSGIFDKIVATQFAPQPAPFAPVGRWASAPSATDLFGAGAFAQAPKAGSPVAPPEAWNVSAPFSTMSPDQKAAWKPPAFKKNQNIIDSIGNVVGGMFSGQELNLGNVVPFLMERPFVAAQAVTDWVGTDILHAPKPLVQAVHDAVGLPVQAIKAGSDVIAQPFNMVRRIFT